MDTRPSSFALRFAGVAGLLFALSAILSGAQATLLQTMLVIAALGVSFQIVFALIGQLSLGHSALFGAGAYTYAFMALHGVPAPLAVLGACAVGAATGFAVSLATARLGGAYFAIVTYALTSVIAVIVSASEPLGQSEGLIGVPSFTALPFARSTAQTLYAALCFLTVLLGFYMLWRSRLGAMLEAVRTDPALAASLGINVPFATVTATTLSGLFAGLVGATFAQQARFVGPDVFHLYYIVTPLAAVVIGGPRALLGALLGSIVVVAVPLSLSVGPIANQVISGTLLTAFAILAPQGLAGLAGRLRHRRAAVPTAAAGTIGIGLAEEPPAGPPLSAEPVLAASGIDVSFGALKAVRGVSLAIRPGEIVGLIGANGAGKSTFVNAIAGRLTPQGGHVTIAGKRVDGLPPHARARLGLARTFQDNAVVDTLTVRQLVDLSAHHGQWASAGLGHLEEVLKSCGLEHLAGAKIASLTYLDRRLVALAAALAGKPRILLLDEATAGLTADERGHIGALVKAVARKWSLGVLVIEHDVEFVARIADRIIVMSEGALLAEGNPGEVLQAPEVVASYLGNDWNAARAS